jgi:hypothetical protein
MSEPLQGRRVDANTPIDDLRPGDYRPPRNGILWGRAPDGEIVRIDERWSLTEHEDGTVTVGPLLPGGSSSIQIHGEHGWHGYLERGVWREA